MSYLLNLTSSSPLLTYSPDIASSGSASSGWSGWLGTGTASSSSGGGGYATYGQIGWIGLSGMQASAFIPYFSTTSSSYSLIYQIDSGTSTELALASSGTSIPVTSTTTDSTTTHSLTVQVTCTDTGGCDPSTPFVFEGIGVESTVVASGSTASQATLDDSSNIIDYTGFYTSTGDGSDTGGSQFVQTATVAASGGSTLSLTATSNATASIYFTGTAILVTGISGPNMGTYDILIDGQVQNHTPYNASSTVEEAQVILGFVNGLDQGEHVMAVQNGEGGLAIDGFVGYGSAGCCFGQGCTPSTADPAPTQTASPTISISASVIVSQVSTAGAVVVSSTGVIGLEKTGPSAGTIVGSILGALAALSLVISLVLYKLHRDVEVKKPEISTWDKNNLLAAQANQYVEVTPETGGQQGYTWPRQVAASQFD